MLPADSVLALIVPCRGQKNVQQVLLVSGNLVEFMVVRLIAD